jgi:putative heme-binding domain-containing protein
VKEWSLEELIPNIERGLKQPRNLERGRILYSSVGCASCHRFGNEGGGVGPDLSAVSGRFGVRDLLESIVEPSKVISDQYAAIAIALKDGRTMTGRVGNLFADNLSIVEDMFDPGRMTNVKREDIEEIKPSGVSPMPAGLLNSLSLDEINDLVAFLFAQAKVRVSASQP